jgi:hypothetical protein
VKFRATIRYWRPESKSGLAVADIPAEHIVKLGGLKQRRVEGRINRAEFVSNVMPAGSGRLTLSVSQKMMAAAAVRVGDEAEFEMRAIASAGNASSKKPAGQLRRGAARG